MKESIRKYLCIIALASITGTINAQRRWHHSPPRHRVVYVSPKVVVRPANIIRATTSSKDRLAMAVAYLKENKYLKISKYANMTGITKSNAEAELNAFCLGKHNVLVKTMINGKVRYTLAKRFIQQN